MIDYKPLATLLDGGTRNGLTKPKRIRGNGVKMIGMGEIFSNSRISDIDMERVPVTEKELLNCGVSEKDLLFARQSLVLEGAGKCSIVTKVKEPTVFESHLIRVRIDEELANPYFIYYFFNSALGHRYVMTIVEQVAAAGLRGSDLVKLKIPCPSIEVQNKSVLLLDKIDEKIEINNAINKNLEEQAQAIYKSWFVDFSESTGVPRTESEFGSIPNDFTVSQVGSLPILVTDYVANGSFASLKANVTLYQEPNYAYFIRNTDLKTGSFGVFVDQHSYNFLSKSTLYGGEVIISNVGDVGSVFLCPKLDAPMTLGNNIIMLRPKNDNLRLYLYLWFKYGNGQSIIQGIKGGSAQPKFNKTDFKNTNILIPPGEMLSRFHNVIEAMFLYIGQNNAESKKLITLRIHSSLVSCPVKLMCRISKFKPLNSCL